MGVETLMKGFLVFFNIIFFLIGAATLALGIWVKVDAKHLLDLTKSVSGADLETTDIPSLLENAVIVMIVAGSLIFFIGFIGCCGALKSHSKAGKLFLKVYAAIVLIVLIIEIAGVAVAWLFLDKVEVTLQVYLDKSLKNQYKSQYSIEADGSFSYSSGGDPLTLAWDIIQLQFECCGRMNGSDYVSSELLWDDFRSVTFPNGTTLNMTVPPSCCPVAGGTKTLLGDLKQGSNAEYSLENPTCPFEAADTQIPGCYDEVRASIKSNSVIFIAIGGTTLFLEFICITFACCLAKQDQDSVRPIK